MSHKRVDMLLESVAMLHADGYPVRCRIIGGGPEHLPLTALADTLRISDAVEFFQAVRGQAELYGLPKSARVFVFPSLTGKRFGIAALEAMACGLPVVTTSAPDNLAQYLVAKSARGIVCDPSPRAIADAVKGLVAGREGAAAEISFGAEPWLDDYSWAAAAAKVSAALAL